MDSLITEIRFALRHLARSPSFSILVILTLALGIRMALGADASEVRRMVVRHGLAPVGIGIVIGVAGAAAAAQTLRGLLYNVQPLDPVTLVVVPTLIVAAALVASLIPAVRASRVEPSDVLRGD